MIAGVLSSVLKVQIKAGTSPSPDGTDSMHYKPGKQKSPLYVKFQYIDGDAW